MSSDNYVLRTLRESAGFDPDNVLLVSQAADLIEQQAERIKELEAELASIAKGVKISVPTQTMEQEFQNHYRRGYEAGKAALRQRIADAPVVAWEYALCSPNAVLDRQASHVNWDERYQPFGRSGVDYATGARVQKRPLISKKDLL